MMITPVVWQQALAEALSDPVELFTLLELPKELLPAAFKADADFRLKVPRSFIQKMTKGDIKDPLLVQILPSGIEMEQRLGFVDDPLLENHVNPIPGLLHKYQSRALLIVTGACGINCRYCFRRHFPYHDNKPSQTEWIHALDYLQQHPEINEVILSGGDPLLAPDHVLAALVAKISMIPHIQTLRIHTRLPVFIPSRITPALITWFTTSRLKPVLVTHINHPREIDASFVGSMQRLQKNGVTLLNQSVLLRGVNDQVDVLRELSITLFQQAGILPYYLHLLDRVNGGAHFEVPVVEATLLMQRLRAALAGYLVPRLAQEVAGAASKFVLG